MQDGKKGTAQKIVYGAFDIVKERTSQEPLEVFNKALENIMPVLEVKARRVGGANYQVPIEVRRREDRRWVCAGWLRLLETATNVPCANASLTRLSMLSTVPWSFQEKRRCTSYGRSQPCFCSLQMVTC
jgi:ribosomal protein S7